MTALARAAARLRARRMLDRWLAANRWVGAGPRRPVDHLVIAYGRWLALLLPQRTRAAMVRTNVNAFLRGIADLQGGWVTVDELLAASDKIRHRRDRGGVYAFDEIFDLDQWLAAADRGPAPRLTVVPDGGGGRG